jgi:arylsulfatase
VKRSQPLFWEHEGNRAVRDGKWKLVAKENQPWELYDMERDRTEQHNLASSEPVKATDLATKWDAYAARANVLPLGAWRGKTGGPGGDFSTDTRFELEAGEHLDRSEAPDIAGRGFTITAKFDARGAREGVLVAHGGSALGYALFLADEKIQFLVRNRTGISTVSAPLNIPGLHNVVARLDPQGALSLALDSKPAITAAGRGLIPAMPGEGLDVGSDEGASVGPYKGHDKFPGAIESILIELK